jgi:hypothetical protein
MATVLVMNLVFSTYDLIGDQNEAKGANKKPKRGPREAKSAPKELQETKRGPRNQKVWKNHCKIHVLTFPVFFRRGKTQHRSDEADPREAQESAKTGPRQTQDKREPRKAKTNPKTAQDRPKRPQEKAKRHQEKPQGSPRGTQEAPKRAQKSTQAAGEPQDTPKNPQEVPKSAQKEAQKRHKRPHLGHVLAHLWQLPFDLLSLQLRGQRPKSQKLKA